MHKVRSVLLLAVAVLVLATTAAAGGGDDANPQRPRSRKGGQPRVPVRTLPAKIPPTLLRDRPMNKTLDSSSNGKLNDTKDAVQRKGTNVQEIQENLPVKYLRFKSKSSTVRNQHGNNSPTHALINKGNRLRTNIRNTTVIPERSVSEVSTTKSSNDNINTSLEHMEVHLTTESPKLKSGISSDCTTSQEFVELVEKTSNELPNTELFETSHEFVIESSSTSALESSNELPIEHLNEALNKLTTEIHDENTYHIGNETVTTHKLNTNTIQIPSTSSSVEPSISRPEKVSQSEQKKLPSVARPRIPYHPKMRSPLATHPKYRGRNQNILIPKKNPPPREETHGQNRNSDSSEEKDNIDMPGQSATSSQNTKIDKNQKKPSKNIVVHKPASVDSNKNKPVHPKLRPVVPLAHSNETTEEVTAKKMFVETTPSQSDIHENIAEPIVNSKENNESVPKNPKDEQSDAEDVNKSEIQSKSKSKHQKLESSASDKTNIASVDSGNEKKRETIVLTTESNQMTNISLNQKKYHSLQKQETSYDSANDDFKNNLKHKQEEKLNQREKLKPETSASKSNNSNNKLSHTVAVVSIFFISLTTFMTILGVYYKKLSFSSKRYGDHMLLSTEEDDLTLFNRQTNYDSYRPDYDSWKSLMQSP